MKKRTDEEKRLMIEEACYLFNEARGMIKKGRKLFHLCGVELCDRFSVGKVEGWNTYGCNLQVYSGIRNMEKILGVEIFHKKDFISEEIDKSTLIIAYKGLIFLQRNNS